MAKPRNNRDDIALGAGAILRREATSRCNPVVSAQTLEALKAGDHDAFNKIFALYFSKIKYFISLLVLSNDCAEEIAQGIFCNLWEKRNKIDASKNFTSYLYLIARHAVYDFLRRKNVRDSYAVDTWEMNSELPSSEELVMAKETELLIDIVVSKMPAQRKKIFELSRYENLSTDEIAQLLGITPSAVGKQLRLALDDVRQVIMVFLLLIVSQQ